MNFRELQERCKNRNFDQIIVVTKDIFKTLANMQKIEHVTPGYIGMQTDKTHPGLKVLPARGSGVLSKYIAVLCRTSGRADII